MPLHVTVQVGQVNAAPPQPSTIISFFGFGTTSRFTAPSDTSPATEKSVASAALRPSHVRVQSTVPAVVSEASATGAPATATDVPSAHASPVPASYGAA